MGTSLECLAEQEDHCERNNVDSGVVDQSPPASMHARDSKTPEFSLTDDSGDSFLLVVALPDVKSIAEVILDVAEQSVAIEAPSTPRLVVPLPDVIVPDQAAAKFSKKRSELRLVLPKR